MSAHLRRRLSPRRVEDRLRVRPSRPAPVPGAVVDPPPTTCQGIGVQPVAPGDPAHERPRRLTAQRGNPKHPHRYQSPSPPHREPHTPPHAKPSDRHGLTGACRAAVGSGFRSPDSEPRRARRLSTVRPGRTPTARPSASRPRRRRPLERRPDSPARARDAARVVRGPRCAVVRPRVGPAPTASSAAPCVVAVGGPVVLVSGFRGGVSVWFSLRHSVRGVGSPASPSAVLRRCSGSAVGCGGIGA